MKPMVSVIMSVYNSEAYLKAAVESILNQTYRDFEFLIVNDCSSDSSLEILHSYRDQRIKIIDNPENLGLAKSLNKAVKQAGGKYIARMDSDDISLPDRFEKQVAYLESHPDTGLVYGDLIRFHSHELANEMDSNDYQADYIRSILLFYNVVNHPCVMMKREIFDSYSYNPDFSVTEDVKLWTEISAQYPMERLPDNLLLYRVHEKQVSTAKRDLQRRQELVRVTPWLKALLGRVSEEELALHGRIAGRETPVTSEQALSWLHRLRDGNEKEGLFPTKAFRQVLLRMYVTTAAYNHYPLFQKLKGCMSFGFFEVVRFGLRVCRNLLADDWYWRRAKRQIKKWRISYE